jgi:hypothetical protein
MILTISIWAGIYLLCFLLRKHLDFGIKQGWHLHWIVGFLIPIAIWIAGGITGWFTPFEIGLYGFTSVIVAASLKELVYDKLLSKGNCTLEDWLVTVSAGFSGTFFFVVPILNS